MKETKLKCPSCGAEFALDEHECMVTGMKIAKDSGLGTIFLKLDKPGNQTFTAEQKLEALKKAGIDTTGITPVKTPQGGSVLMKMTEDGISIIDEEDETYKAIISKGVIPNRTLFRRWVAAQMSHMLYATNYKPLEYIRTLGVKYSWEMFREEMRVQFILKDNGDEVNFAERRHWFKPDLIVDMADSLVGEIKNIILQKKLYYNSEGNTCIDLIGEQIKVSDLDRFYETMRSDANEVLACHENPSDYLEALDDFMAKYVYPLRKEKRAFRKAISQSKAWQNAYIGVGAYYTLKNFILFHGMYLPNDRQKTSDSSLALLHSFVKKKKYTGWQMLGLLKSTLKVNNIDLKAKMDSWAK